MPRNFYYGKDAEIVAGSANFASLLSADYASYGCTLLQAERYAGYDAALQSAYAAVAAPHTRTPVAIRIKDEARRDVQHDAALLATVIAAQPTVSDGQLLALGLVPRPTRAARSAPQTPPVVNVASVVGRVVTVRLSASSAGGARMPAGCIGALVYSFVGESSPADARAYRFEGLAPRKTYTIMFPNGVASGATAWISVAWVSKRGETSIACTPVRVTIQGGPVLAAA